MRNPFTSITKSFTTNAYKLLRHRHHHPTTTTRHDKSPLIPKTTTKQDQYRQVFRYFDSNNDGNISADELRSYFSSFGDSLSREEAEKMVIALSSTSDDNQKVRNNVLLEFDEFVKAMESRDESSSNINNNNVVLRQAFEVYDDGNGFITPQGLHDVLRRLGDVRSYEECRAMIRVFDLDGNGVVDFHEFCQMMN